MCQKPWQYFGAAPEKRVGGGHSAMVLDGGGKEGHGSIGLPTSVQLSSQGSHALRHLQALGQSQPAQGHLTGVTLHAHSGRGTLQTGLRTAFAAGKLGSNFFV